MWNSLYVHICQRRMIFFSARIRHKLYLALVKDFVFSASALPLQFINKPARVRDALCTLSSPAELTNHFIYSVHHGYLEGESA